MKQHTFILTWAQSRTPVHKPLWDNILRYAKHLDAAVAVMPGRYKHVNNPFDSETPDEEDWWDPAVTPWLVKENFKLHDALAVCFDVRISPTDANPLSSMQLFGHGASCIFGHPRYHLRCLPHGDAIYPKLMMTTGACTVENYSDTKVGAKAYQNHIFGFVIVELDDPYYHVRQVNAKSDGQFIDSARALLVNRKGVSKAPPAQALRVGDSHAAEAYEPAIRATIGMREDNRAKRVIVDDIYSHSHAGHRLERGNWDFRLHHTKPLEDELRLTADLIKRLGTTDVMYSNHHVMLDEWVRNVDGRLDPDNVSIWAELVGYMAKGLDGYDLFATWCRAQPSLKGIRFWRRGEACVIGRIRHDHGHEGPSGTRGSISSWRKMGCKITTAHTHTPSVTDGHVCAGHTSDPVLHSYSDNSKSAWMWGNVMQDAFGKRQVILIVPESKGLYRRP